MKTFRSIVVLRRPRMELWTIMRDHLVDFAEQIADIQGIRQIERTEDADGIVHIVNEWRVRQQVPAILRPIVKSGELSWIDRNAWDAGFCTCSWAIEPNILTDHIACSGTTAFAAAMGSQGTRVTFEGSLAMKPGLLSGTLGGFDSLASGFLETIITTIIPRNLRGVVETAASFDLPP